MTTAEMVTYAYDEIDQARANSCPRSEALPPGQPGMPVPFAQDEKRWRE